MEVAEAGVRDVAARARRWRDAPPVPLDLHGPRAQPFEPLPENAPDTPIFAFFEAAARRHPHRPALSDDARTLDYAEALRAVAHIAAAVAATVPPGDAVGIALPTGIWLPACMLAVMAVGRVAVPLDLNAPPQRCEAILKAAAAGAVLSDPVHAPGRVPDGVPMLDAPALGASAAPPPAIRTDTDVHAPAMVIYTSGSTGEPKGIVVDQAGLVHRILLHANACHIVPEDRILPLSTPASIAGAREVLTGLMTGACVHLVDPRREGVEGTLARLLAVRPTVVYTVPTMVRALCALPGAGAALSAIKAVRLGGEPFPWADHDLLRSRLPPAGGIIAAYSSTEAICSHWFVPADAERPGPLVPAGWVNPGMQFLLADEEGGPVPDGTPGRLLIRSRFLALGHWVGGRCVPGPMQPDPDDRMTRIFDTGDMATLLPNGTLRMHGRADDMVKIAGQRVEPREVEQVMRGWPEVAAAAVIVQRTAEGRPVLVGFIEPRAGASGNLLALAQRRLATSLPPAMRPSRLHLVPTMPRSLNTKTDRKALAELDEAAQREAAGTGADAPADAAVAWAVRAAWRRSFGRRSFAADESFEAAGGDSLKLLQFVYDIEQRLGTFTFLPLDLFNMGMRPSEMAAAISALLREDAAAADTRPPVFLFPGLNGDEPLLALFRADLSAELRFTTLAYPDWRRQVLQGAGFEALVDELAARVAREADPIRLAGYSFGGLLAAAVAARLHAAGRRIGFLGLIDTPAHPGPPLDPGPALRAALAGTGVMRQAVKERRLQDVLGLLAAETLGRPALRPMLRGVARLRMRPPLPLRLRFATEAWLQAFLRASTLRRAFTGVPEPVPADIPVVLFRAAEGAPGETADRGWSARAANLRVVHVPGSHHGIFEAGNRAVLTRRFAEAVSG